MPGMSARKYSASMDTELLSEVEQAAGAEGVTVSAWLAEAASRRVSLDGLGRLIDEYEQEHGPFTEEELAASEDWLSNPEEPRAILAEVNDETA